MNTLISQYEKRDKVLIMSSAHAFFSFGGVIGAGLGSLLMFIVKEPSRHMLIVALVLILINALLARFYIFEKADIIQKKAKFSFKLFSLLFAISIIGFVTMAGEGSIVDWSGLYLEQICNADSGSAGLGYMLFSIFMTLGRLTGDNVSRRLGSIKTISYASIISVFALALVLSGYMAISLLGFAFLGIGFSVIVPELFRLGGQTEGVPPAQGIAFVAGVGYIGFVFGPVILGSIADAYDLRASFLFLMISVLFTTILSFSIKRKA